MKSHERTRRTKCLFIGLNNTHPSKYIFCRYAEKLLNFQTVRAIKRSINFEQSKSDHSHFFMDNKTDTLLLESFFPYSYK